MLAIKTSYELTDFLFGSQYLSSAHMRLEIGDPAKHTTVRRKMDDLERNQKALEEFFESSRFINAFDSDGARANFALSLMAEDGYLLRKVSDSVAASANESPLVVWLTMPYFSLVEHETRRAFASQFAVKLARVSESINEIRNYAKIELKDGVSSYVAACEAYLHGLYGTDICSSKLLCEVVLDDSIPLGLTHLLAFGFGADHFVEEAKKSDNLAAQKLGTDNMIAALPNYSLSLLKHGSHAKALREGNLKIGMYDMREVFCLDVNSESNLDAAISLYLSSYLCIFNLMCYMINYCYFNDLLFLKYSLFHFQSFVNGVSNLNKYYYCKKGRSSKLLNDCMLSRLDRNRINRLRKVRNALVHYGFHEWNTLSLLHPRESFSDAIYSCSGYSLLSQVDFLKGLVLDTAETILLSLGANRLLHVSSLCPGEDSCIISDNDLVLTIASEFWLG